MNYIKNIILKNKSLSWLLLATNWIFQGILQADRTEKIYKVSFTLFFWILFFLVFSMTSNMILVNRLLLSLFIAHTLNWFINCNFFVIFVHRMKWLKNSKAKLFKHLCSIQKRLDNQNWILLVISLGGISRGTMNEHSDIDVNIIRKPGVKNAISAILFTTIEKKRADYLGIPLDIFISDSVEDVIKKSNNQKKPVVLYDSNNIIDTYYNEKMNLKEAQLLNKVPE